MSGDTVLCRLMHLIGSDLDLKRLPCAADQRRVQRLVHIGLGHGYIILETPRNRLIHFMNHTQRRITVPHRIHDDTHREQIIDLIYGLILVLHFLVNAEKVFDTSVDLCLDTRMFYVYCHFVYDRLDILLTVALADRDLVHQIVVGFRFQIF